MTILRLVALTALLSLAACTASAVPPAAPYGCIALDSGFGRVLGARGCATQLTAHWAVLAKHEDRVGPTARIDDSDYDLAFFRRDGVAPRWAAARRGETITAFGNPLDPTAPTSVKGRVLAVDFWKGDRDRAMFPAVFFSGPVFPGYSGGPIVDDSGAVLGMFVEVLLAKPVSNQTGAVLQAGDGVALPSRLILAEFKRLVPPSER